MDLSWITLALLSLVCLLAAYVIYMSSQHGVLKKLGIPGPTPVPVLGNHYHLIKEGIFEYYQRIYTEYKTSKIYGHYEGRSPTMVIRDLDLIRDICVKHFNNFNNRRTFQLNKPMDSMLTMLKDDHWKNVRTTMSPTFSTGKLRRMVRHITTCCERLKLNLGDKQRSGEMVELKHTMSCYTMDVIASTGFGVQVDSQKDKKNAFVVAARSIMDCLDRMVSITFLLPFVTAQQLEAVGINVISKTGINFFTRFVDDILGARKQATFHGNSKASDFLQLMVEASEKDDDDLDDDEEEDDGDDETDKEGRESKISSGRKPLSQTDIQAQGFIFILAGFETVSTVLSHALFLLANNPECCQRLQKEIDDKLGKEAPTYETLQNMPYLDMCLSEALRLFPPGVIVDRVCKEDIVIGGTRIPKGMTVELPIYCIHRDPDLWTDPETFDPERFTTENNANRHPFSYLPFGQGPRNCIGMRLALLEMKMAIAAMLQEMTPVACPKTVYPARPKDFNVTAAAGLWVKLNKRK